MKALFYSIILTAAASQLHAARLLVAPSGLANDKAGNVYVTDFQNGRGTIYMYNPKGERLSEVTQGFANNGIGATAIDKRNGVVYFATPNSQNPYERIWKADPNSQKPYEPKSCGFLLTLPPTSLIVDKDGNLYVSANGVLMKYDTKEMDALPKIIGYGNKVFAVDSRNRVYYTSDNGKTLMRATPQANDTYVSEAVQTSGSCSAIAIDDNDTLYIAGNTQDRQITIRKHDRDGAPESFFSGQYGDLRALAIDGKSLYIANGIDGVLQVDAASGLCAGTKLGQLNNPYDYFMKGKTGNYYLTYCRPGSYGPGGFVDEYDSNWTFQRNIAKGKRVKGLTQDKNGNLIYAIQTENEKDNESRVRWEPANKAASATDPFNNPEGVAFTGANANPRVFVSDSGNGTLTSVRLFESGFVNWPGPYKKVETNIKGLRSVTVASNGDVYWVGTIDKAIGKARLVETGPYQALDKYDVNKNFIGDLNDLEAVAVDNDRYVYVAISCQDQDLRHVGRFSPEGKFLSDLYAEGMRDNQHMRRNLRDLFVDSNGRDIIVLQKYVGWCEVWKYSNIFAN